MKSYTTLLLIFFSSVVISQSAMDIITAYQNNNDINSLSSQITYKNISKKGRTQQRQLEQYISKLEKGKDHYQLLLTFTSPNDIAGTSTLTIQSDKGDEQWLYLPAIKRSRKISASKKSDRFMGTELTYEDLSLYLSEDVDAFNYNSEGQVVVKNHMCHVIIASPLPSTTSMYSKRAMYIDTQTNVMIKTDFFDKKGNLLKTYAASDIKKVGATAHYRAHTITINNIQTGNRTEVSYSNFNINESIDESLFSTSYMETL